MAKKSILVVTGTRAEYGLLRSSMDAIIAHPGLELRLLVTGMHTLHAFGYTKEQIEHDGYHIDTVVPVTEGSNQISALAQEVEGIGAYCAAHKPHGILVLGDRDEAFAAAVVATHLNIPLAHIHGGDVSGPGVDELLRHAITKMAHLHFPGTLQSAKRIAAMGEEKWRIFSHGSPCLDFLKTMDFLSRNSLAEELGLNPQLPWLTVLQHPTAFDMVPLAQQINVTLEALTAFPEHEKIIIYPNSDEGNEIFIKRIATCSDSRDHIFPSLSRQQYVSLLKESEALIGNSSSGIIEAGPIGTASIDIGNRQRGRERGEGTISVPYDTKKITVATTHAIALKKKRKGKPFTSPYGKGSAGEHIVQDIFDALANPKLLDKKSAI